MIQWGFEPALRPRYGGYPVYLGPPYLSLNPDVLF